MNEAIYNLLILGGYVALGHLVYWGYEWLWWRHVDRYLARGSRRIKRHRNKRDRAQQQPEIELTGEATAEDRNCYL